MAIDVGWLRRGWPDRCVPFSCSICKGLFESDDFVSLAQQVDVPSATHGLEQGPRSAVPVADKYGGKNGFSELGGQIRYVNAHEGLGRTPKSPYFRRRSD